MVDNHIPNYGETAGPGAAFDNRQINKLARMVDKVTLSRVMLCRMRENGVGLDCIEREVKKWDLGELNAVGNWSIAGGNQVDKPGSKYRGQGRKNDK